ncbi:UDP-3-O-(3-hydroxymyristoyl)glucosamine N-acyltransferase [Pelagicoccus mobilis]|uniref:UDP-3-O-acylglucosamine N-acyltransferase n=1 Tax=Pelagicoccus mobilis TaxID=415221 RepID=A0A934S1I6_9BACT|nr:UDP-3-O-(3-hydroxymyristoyl)glucosamine N-acyltransferase [Pelagicoccus mobilis]MBK1880646.1 UDP-3-O-(3-hydroxymyristoyl)glucosamine N-acyltransferase [Pelagicoccus mobilis]
MTYTIEELAQIVNGEIVGDPTTSIESASTLEAAVPGQIAFLANRKYRKTVATSKASAIVTREPLETEAAQIVVPDPYFAFREIVVHIHGHRDHLFEGISPAAHIAPTAQIGQNVRIAHGATVSEEASIGDDCVLYSGVFVGPRARIGSGCILYPNAVVFDTVEVGDRVVIQCNASVGHDGFGFATHQGSHHKIPHIAKVILQDEVEIGANACIESGAFDDTIIGAGSKIGDSVVIGHGTKIGKGCLLVPQVGIAGSAELGDYSQMGGQAGITGHTKVGPHTVIAAKSLVNHNLPGKQGVLGFPAFDMAQARKSVAIYKNLPKQREKLMALDRKVKELEETIAALKQATEAS